MKIHPVRNSVTRMNFSGFIFMKKPIKISNGVHFIGIGGIGVSALARYYLGKGDKVSGSDLVSSEITDALKKSGVKILIGQHKAKNLPKDVDLVVYSPAVPKDNPELKRAYQIQNTKYDIRILSYPEALGELTKKHFTIAISGTHGKSTTTAMIAMVLIRAGLDPTVIVGTKLKEFRDSNFRFGKKTTQILNTEYKILVIEADEHMASFLNYWPKIIVLTNIEADHLDYYRNLHNIIKTFQKYIGHLPKDGWLVANKDDKNIPKIKYNSMGSKQQKSNIKYYSIEQPEAKRLKKILKIPGEHNVYNALATLATARVLKISDKVSFKTLSEYKGAWRRFEEKIGYIPNTKYKIRIISDYAHHPTKIRVTLKAAREKYPKRKIWCIYQPHQYQRTYYLFRDFVRVFKKALQPIQDKPTVDKLIITDIFDVAGRETTEIKKRVSSEKLVKAIKKESAIYLSKEKIVDFLKNNLKGREVVIIMGAGDIYELNSKLKSQNLKIRS